MANVKQEHIEIKHEPLAYHDCPMLVTNDMNVKCELIQDVEIKDEEIDIQEEAISLERESSPVKQQIAQSGEIPSQPGSHDMCHGGSDGHKYFI